jgi:hypothetical protein
MEGCMANALFSIRCRTNGHHCTMHLDMAMTQLPSCWLKLEQMWKHWTKYDISFWCERWMGVWLMHCSRCDVGPMDTTARGIYEGSWRYCQVADWSWIKCGSTVHSMIFHLGVRWKGVWLMHCSRCDAVPTNTTTRGIFEWSLRSCQVAYWIWIKHGGTGRSMIFHLGVRWKGVWLMHCSRCDAVPTDTTALCISIWPWRSCQVAYWIWIKHGSSGQGNFWMKDWEYSWWCTNSVYCL